MVFMDVTGVVLMNKILKEMEDRANNMICACGPDANVQQHTLCSQCQVAVDQARLLAVLRTAIDGLCKTVDMEQWDERFYSVEDVLIHIDQILEGKIE